MKLYQIFRVKRLASPARSLAAGATLVGALVSGVVMVLGGCASSAGIAPVAQPLPAVAVGAVDGVALPAIDGPWWRVFGDAELDALVERALAGSPGLAVARSRVVRAAAGADVARAADGLQVNGSADVTRQRFSGNSIYPQPLGGSMRTLANAQLGASWEFDFFGRNRAAIESAVGAGRAAEAELQSARIVLASNVARSYVQLGRLLEQRAVAERSLKQREEVLDLINQRVRSGLDTAVEQRQGEAALPETRQQIELLDEQITLTRHALAALTAQAPQALGALSPVLRAVQLVPPPAEVPADLLGRRADVTAARWRIEAAGADMRSARAQFYPNVNLTAFIGLASIGLDRLVNAGSEQYGAGPALRLPIFDAGRLRANLRGKAADVDAAVESYNSAVVEAIHETADALGSLRAIERQQQQQALAQTAAESAFDLSTQRFRAGLSTYLTVLNAEAAVLAQRRSAADLKARALETQIALVKALGGGWTPQAADLPPLALAPPARP